MFREKLLILWSRIRSNLLATSLGAVGLLFILIGLASIILSSNKEGEISFESASEASPSGKIVVDIAGAVVNPGVYQLNVEARLQDVLIMAGGLAATADREWVARNLNLATKLKDGIKVYIPEKGQNSNVKTQNYGGEAIGIQAEGLVSINAASLSELDKLPGIGPVTAQKIIDNRPYTEIGELLNKKVVGRKVFEQIKGKITIY